MASDKIGSVQFDLIERAEQPAGLRAETEVFERDGIDAHEVVGIGTRGPLFTWGRCFKWSTSAANALSFIEDVEELVGQLVTIYDAYEADYEDVLVKAVDVAGPPKYVYKDGDERWQTEFNVRMQRME